MVINEPFLSDGFVSLNSDSVQSTPIKILRDTGASQSLILADTLPFSEKNSSGTSVLIQGVEFGFVNVPLHNIYLSSDLVTGLVAVGIRPSLPFKGVHLLLGNYLAGDKVVVNKIQKLSSFKSNENIHKREDGSYYIVSANKASSVTL